MAEIRWSLDLKKYAEAAAQKVRDAHREITYSLYHEIVQGTPKDTGRAQGNWNVSVGNADASIDDSKTTPQYTSADQLPETKGDESYFISNNMPYIRKLEYGGYGKYVNGEQVSKSTTDKTIQGFSRRAPHGMVGVALANAKQYIDKVIRNMQ